MPYLIFTANGEEFDRRDLSRPLIVGRAADCDVSIHDIILSRHHCRIEPLEDDRWQIIDLHSKNGTQYLGQSVERHTMKDGDELRVGRTRVAFRAGAYVAPSASQKRRQARAADPKEALAGTVSGMVVCEPGETQRSQNMPFPQPRPADPSAYVRDDVYGMISQIISNSWDSIHQQASEPIKRQRAIPVPGVTQAINATARPKQHVSFALQAQADAVTSPPAISTAERNSSEPETMLITLPRSRVRRWRLVRAWLIAAVALVFIMLALASPQEFGAPLAQPTDRPATPSANPAPPAAPSVATMNTAISQNAR